ncbi:MAG: 23S rRNA (pseudouridine(1915)-N(3))-methyltransferase RlmH [Pseudomonadota bacterium]
MKLSLIAVGSMKSGPERELFDDYAARFRRTGQGLGFREFRDIEVDSGGGLNKEGERILAKLPTSAMAYRLDEHGKSLGSVDFANTLARLRDDGVPELVFLIGGAEGYSREVRKAVPQTLAFGVQTWPHRLVRAMLAEQLYRAASILAGGPYHKA